MVFLMKTSLLKGVTAVTCMQPAGKLQQQTRSSSVQQHFTGLVVGKRRGVVATELR